jgi:ATP-binding cassette subfamily B multidrug efflux pump
MKKDSITGKTLIKVLKRIRPYTPLLIISFLLATLTVALTLYLPVLFGETIDAMVERGNVNFDIIFDKLIIAAIIIALTAVAQWIMSICNSNLSCNIVRDLREEAFLKIRSLPLKYIDSHSYGDTVSRIIADADQFSEGLLMGFTQLFSGVLTIVGIIFFMLRINLWVTLVVVLCTPMSLLIAKFVAKKTFSMFSLQSKTRGEQTAFIDEMIHNQKTVQAFGREDENLEKFDEINERLHKCSLRAIFFSSTVNPTTRFMNNIVYAGVALVGAILCINRMLTVGALSTMLSYTTQYTKPFNEISGVMTELQNALACAARIFELIEEPEQTSDADLPEMPIANGELSLEKVYFSYTADKELIKDLNLKVKPGQRIAIVGPTGCGKTTLINLLMRFYDVDSGSIKVDGNDIRSVTRHSLRKNYGMVLQETWLKGATVKENIAFGRPDADDEEIIAAAKAAHAHSFIKRLPNGYDTVIGEDGSGLSQGQKQLLCIARIMLCMPPMLILDEATSSIDTRTEIKIQRAFATLMKGRTSFIVAHRLSTIREADVILVMKDGNIIEQGDHASLMAANGFYANLYNSQFAAS